MFYSILSRCDLFLFVWSLLFLFLNFIHYFLHLLIFHLSQFKTVACICFFIHRFLCVRERAFQLDFNEHIYWWFICGYGCGDDFVPYSKCGALLTQENLEVRSINCLIKFLSFLLTRWTRDHIYSQQNNGT